MLLFSRLLRACFKHELKVSRKYLGPARSTLEIKGHELKLHIQCIYYSLITSKYFSSYSARFTERARVLLFVYVRDNIIMWVMFF